MVERVVVTIHSSLCSVDMQHVPVYFYEQVKWGTKTKLRCDSRYGMLVQSTRCAPSINSNMNLAINSEFRKIQYILRAL